MQHIQTGCLNAENCLTFNLHYDQAFIENVSNDRQFNPLNAGYFSKDLPLQKTTKCKISVGRTTQVLLNSAEKKTVWKRRLFHVASCLRVETLISRFKWKLSAL